MYLSFEPDDVYVARGNDLWMGRRGGEALSCVYSSSGVACLCLAFWHHRTANEPTNRCRRPSVCACVYLGKRGRRRWGNKGDQFVSGVWIVRG